MFKKATPIPGISKEEWRLVRGYKTFQISNFGRIRTLRKDGYWWSKKAHYSKKRGYLKTQLPVTNKKRPSVLVHTLVAESFIGKRKSGFCVNHKDLVKTNNKITNLEYLKIKENSTHAALNGAYLPTTGDNHWTRKQPWRRKTGIKNGRAKLDWDTVLFIRKNKSKFSLKELAEKFNVSKRSIADIIKNRTWREV